MSCILLYPETQKERAVQQAGVEVGLSKPAQRETSAPRRSYEKCLESQGTSRNPGGRGSSTP